MLRFMRKYATGWLVKALFGIIIAVFVLYFGSSNFRESDKVVAEVGSDKITYTEYLEAYNRMFNFYKLLYKDNVDDNAMKALNIKEKAMDELVSKHLLLLEAKEMGIRTTDNEFNDYIGNMNAFKRDGKFSQKTYLDVLRMNNMDPKKFEESEKTNLTILKVTSIINDNGYFLNDADLWASYVKEKGKVNLFYIQVDPAAYKDKVNVDEKELQSLYEKEKGAYKSENLYRLKYLVIDEKSSVKDDAAYMDLLKLKDVDAYGKKNGLEVVDTGLVKESDLSKKFKNMKIDDRIKGLKKGEISLPIRVDSKSYIFQLVDAEEGKPFDKDVVLKELKEKILMEKAKVFAKGKAEELISKQAIETKNDTGFIPRNVMDIPKIGPLPKNDIGVLALSKNHPLYEKPVEISGKYYIFYYKDEKLPERDEWEKDKKAYSNYIISKNREEYFKSFLEDLKKKEKVNIFWKEI
jgi:parvulin-like peptidyl-prolyl isomerase